MNKWALIVPAVVFFVILIFSFIFTAPYDIYEEQWGKITDYYAGVEQDLIGLEKDVTLLERKMLIIMPQNTSLDQVRINDAVVDITELSGDYTSKAFVGCYFKGDGNIYITNSDFSSCSYRDNPNPFMVVSDLPSNTISFNNCTFENCIFWDVSFVGDANEIEQLQTKITEG